MKKQKNRKKSKQKIFLQFMFAAMALCGAVSLLGDLAAWVVCRMGGISFSVPSAATIGIIGGADGPTSVFVTASAVSWWKPVFKLLALGIGILGWHSMNRRKGEE